MNVFGVMALIFVAFKLREVVEIGQLPWAWLLPLIGAQALYAMATSKGERRWRRESVPGPSSQVLETAIATIDLQLADLDEDFRRGTPVVIRGQSVRPADATEEQFRIAIQAAHSWPTLVDLGGTMMREVTLNRWIRMAARHLGVEYPFSAEDLSFWLGNKVKDQGSASAEK